MRGRANSMASYYFIQRKESLKNGGIKHRYKLD